MKVYLAGRESALVPLVRARLENDGAEVVTDDVSDLDVVLLLDTGAVPSPVLALVMDGSVRVVAQESASGERMVERVLERLGVRALVVRTAAVVGRQGGDDAARPFYSAVLSGLGGRSAQWPVVHAEDVARFLSAAVLAGLGNEAIIVELVAPGEVSLGELSDLVQRKVIPTGSAPVTAHEGHRAADVVPGFEFGWDAHAAAEDFARFAARFVDIGGELVLRPSRMAWAPAQDGDQGSSSDLDPEGDSAPTYDAASSNPWDYDEHLDSDEMPAVEPKKHRTRRAITRGADLAARFARPRGLRGEAEGVQADAQTLLDADLEQWSPPTLHARLGLADDLLAQAESLADDGDDPALAAAVTTAQRARRRLQDHARAIGGERTDS